MQNGKGSKPRPIKDIKGYISNWDTIDWSKPVNAKSTVKNLTPSSKKDK